MGTATSREHDKSGSRRSRIVIGTLAALVILATAAVVFNEYLSYNEDISTCYSDNMWVLKDGLADYCREHDGQMPATFDELRAYMKGKHGATYDVCVRANAPFVWMPQGITTADGRSVVLMCPPNSHGWLRKYAFGLARDEDGTFYFVRVRHGRATRFGP
jgi:hypothetical protein